MVYKAAAGVCNTTLGVPADCGDERGGLFDSASSSSWELGQGLSQYSLGLNTDLGYDGVGQYGLLFHLLEWSHADQSYRI